LLAYKRVLRAMGTSRGIVIMQYMFDLEPLIVISEQLSFQRAEFSLNYLRNSQRELFLGETLEDGFEFLGVHTSLMKVLDELLRKCLPFLSQGILYWI
jgi:hypothetical protein